MYYTPELFRKPVLLFFLNFNFSATTGFTLSTFIINVLKFLKNLSWSPNPL